MNHGKVYAEIANGLLKLKERIKAANIPSSKLDETINIATWNIREFGKKKRSIAAIHYIAEILGQFDLIGLVELRDNLSDLGRVLEILGPYWRAVYSDMITDAGGNRERIAYLYDNVQLPLTAWRRKPINHGLKRALNICPNRRSGAVLIWLRLNPAASISWR